jgi:dolichol kinase
MNREWFKELGRKTFHQLSLAFLIVYYWIGYPRIIRWMIPWTILVFVVETSRLYIPAVNKLLFDLMGGLAREEERNHYSGIVSTTVGAFILFLALRDQARFVAAGLLCVSLGDTAAALVGKAVGRHHLFGSKKSIEGSAACFLTCAAVGTCLGFSAGSALAGASAGTIIEFLPTSLLFNDNMWMPIGVALTLKLCAG